MTIDRKEFPGRVSDDHLEKARRLGEVMVRRHENIDLYREHGMSGGFVELASRDVDLTDTQKHQLAITFREYVESNVGQIVLDTAPPNNY